MIGDDEPADGYDRGDPIPVRLRVIARIVEVAAERGELRHLVVARALLREVAADLDAPGPGDL